MTTTEQNPTLTPCQTCGKPEDDDALCQLTDGTVKCVECWNAEVAHHKAERKAELAARPACECCGKRPGTWRLGEQGDRVLTCGPCKARVKRHLPHGNIFIGYVRVTRDDIMRMGRS